MIQGSRSVESSAGLAKGLKRHGKSVGYRILEFLDKAKPGCLVMGAYEHSKFRQSIMGGVTSSVLKEAKVPVLISH